MKKLSLLLLSGLFSLAVLSQNDPRIAHAKTPLDQIPVAVMPHLDNTALLAAEMAHRAPGIAPRFAEPIEVSINPVTNGHWEQLANGNALWRLRIRSGGAKSLNLGFTKYLMPAGGSLILYSPDYQTVMGPFTPADNEEHEQLWTPILPGEELVVEVQLPAHSQSALQLELKYVNHDFVGFAEMASGSCNLDVICGGADGWAIVDQYRDIIQSVAVISTGGTTFCTGFLVNNARQDCTPYFMTANHCGITGGQAPSLVTYWNFFNSTCRQPGSPGSGNNGNGQLNDFNTGSVLRATGSNSDFTLVELDDPVSETADAFFAGWSAEDFAPTDTVIGIHHPSTDEKRISFEFQPTFIADYNSTTPNPNGTHLTILDWDVGTTEGGSSGSPLYNRKKQVVGQLHGGAAACGNNLQDSYGWFHISWEGGGMPNNSLKPWLDPDNTGVIVLDGRSALQCSYFVAGSPANISLCVPADAVYEITVSPNFTDSVTLSVPNLPAGLTATFVQNPVAPGDTTTLTLSNTAAIAEGNYTLSLDGTDGTESNSSDLMLLVAAQSPMPPAQVYPADGEDGIGLTPNFTWSAVAGVKYTIEIATDTAFTDVIETASNLTVASYIPIAPLAQTATYFWRVRGDNICGQGNWPTLPSSFTTSAITCGPAISTNVPITIPTQGTPTVTSTLTITGGGSVDDINVSNLNIAHTWVGDLRVELTSPMGTTAVLFASPGGGDCSANNVLISLDDQAAATNDDLLNMCNGVPPAIAGTFQPQDALSVFNGEPIAGNWVLIVHDDVSQDGGSIIAWGLDLCSTIPNDLSVSPSANAFTSCVDDSIFFNLVLGTAFDDTTDVTLTAENLPAGATATFTPNPATPGATVDVTVSGAANAGSFNFEVVATDGLNQSGNAPVQWTVQGGPVAPMGIAPAQGAMSVSVNPVFSWSATGNSYMLIVSTNPSPTMQNAILITNPGQPSYASNGLFDPCTTYYWTVAATNNCGFTPGTSVYSFTTLDDLSFDVSPNSVTVCPTGNATFSLPIGDCFEPSGVTIAVTGTPMGGLAFISQNPAPAGSTATIDIGLSNVAPGSYPITITGNDGVNTVTETVTLNIAAPAAAPVFVYPANAAIGINVLTVFDWDPVAGATSYHFQLATDNNFTNIVTDVTIPQTAYTLSSPLNVNTTYYWRVTALNICGSTNSAPWSFITWPVNAVKELNGLSISILPNPTTGMVNVQFSQPTFEAVDATLFSVNGILVKNQAVQIGSKSTSFDLTELPSGAYLLRLKSGSAVLTEKIILEK
ncbi:MAG: proprotein convertase P-domain-containing protein [Saprospiraceae bacterium]|nr:proprotein convertase P-domain-containing protein [Saprospiraceae bacterium]MCF8251438.1 proprotein convertase P-domain-containing protein [Saprospiraceae bacterium]MCF8282566.1 proprotein convertase P-domain-containing protein [Bacteroidales bacterium]MCF8313033.1 proprotein convertase P-domain-containing protein [Saprospiraceae bacterium]MCF8441480.1 proprotein convertase P-domain-containing protein [Saprospiraceae bacterium]